MMSKIEHNKTTNAILDIIDTGDRNRYAVALRLTKWHDEALQDATKKAYIQGGVDEILRHEKASKAVLDHLSKKGTE